MTDADGLSAQAQLVPAAQTAFGLHLLSLLAKESPRHNVFVSPSSVFLALSMLETGAAGGTRSALRRTLHIPRDVSEAALHESVTAWSGWLRKPGGAELSIANALWADRHVTLSPDFVGLCRRFYQAHAETLDFSSPDAAGTINAWVKTNTGNKIAEIVSVRAVAASKAILTNAVYFKGKWQYPFDRKLTQYGAFHHADQTVKQVPLMHQEGLKHAYRSGDGYESAVLPYGLAAPEDNGGGLVLCVLLPQPGKDVSDVLAKVDVRRLLDREEPAELDLRLPRFTLDYSASLKMALAQMGMAAAFEYGAADFSPLGSREFFVGDVLHKTRLEVDEEGTVAAAATAITAPMGMPRPLPKRIMTVDRPFALLLCGRQTGAVVFAGMVYSP
jgi:serpin B